MVAGGGKGKMGKGEGRGNMVGGKKSWRDRGMVALEIYIIYSPVR